MNRQALQRLMTEAYPANATGLLRPILDLLTLGREACGGDLDKLLILFAVGVRTTEHRGFAAYSQEELLSGKLKVFPSLGINIQSVADSVGMPKETVRRKVTELVAQGWIARQGNELYFTGEAYRTLAPIRERIEQLAIEYHDLVGKIARSA